MPAARHALAPLAALVFGACGAEPPPPPPPPPPRASARPIDTSQAALPVPQRPEGPPKALLERLASRGVHASRLDARVIYTWTTTEQLAELRKTKKLVVRSESPTKGRSAFDGKLERVVARTGSGMAQLLQKSPLDKRRFAFPNAFATSLGLHGEDYGSVLVEIRLRADARLVHLTASDALGYLDLSGKPVSSTEAEKDPGRIAGVLNVEQTYREIVISNEAAIERWSVCTPELASAVRAEMSLVRAVAAELPQVLAPLPNSELRGASEAQSVWSTAPSGEAGLERLALGAMASLDPAYDPSSVAWKRLATSLERAIACPGEPLVVEPKLAYPKLVVPPPKAPVWRAPPRRRPRGTFM